MTISHEQYTYTTTVDSDSTTQSSSSDDTYVNLYNTNRRDSGDHSLAKYLICSTHNTYMCGGQLIGTSSVDQYKKVYLNGGRSIEIDLYHENGKWSIRHEDWWVGSVSLSDFLNVTKEYAFKNNTNPIIFSFQNEMHSKSDDDAFVKLAKQYWGDMLYTKPAQDKFPKLKNCQRKIIIRAKHHVVLKKGNVSRPASKKLIKISPLFQSIKVNEKTLSENNWRKTFTLKSDDPIFSNGKARKYEKYNMTHITRTYPTVRYNIAYVTSLNYNPVLCWRYGVQLVAINWQKNDVYNRVYRHVFLANNSAGYLLKPKNGNTPRKIKFTIAAQKFKNLRIKSFLLSKETNKHTVIVKNTAKSINFNTDCYGFDVVAIQVSAVSGMGLFSTEKDVGEAFIPLNRIVYSQKGYIKLYDVDLKPTRFKLEGRFSKG